MKAGTTALYKYLKQHPDIFMSRPKETFFFGNRHSHALEKYSRYEQGLEWFASHFEAWNGEKAVGEASTDTMYSPKGADRVAADLPDAKLLFVLRNPIDRAYSHYWWFIQAGYINGSKSFHEVIRDRECALRRDLIEKGLYAQQIDRFDRHFDRRQMRFVLQRDLQGKTTRVVQDIYEFLGVDSNFSPETTRRNVTEYPLSRKIYHWIRRSWHVVPDAVESQLPQITEAARNSIRKLLFSQDRPSMCKDDRAYLRDIYEAPNAKLEDKIDRDLSHWS